MKTNKLWYLGYLVGICSLLAVFTLNLNEVVKVLLIFVFAISVSVSYVQLTHIDYWQRTAITKLV